MTTPAVHWQEGMFLQPHHFQTAARHSTDQLRRNVKWDCYHNWALRRRDYDRAGYEVVPVLTVDRSPRGDGLPVVDATDIPPLLCCEAWPGLQHDILQATFQRLGRKLDLLADMVVNRGLTLDSRGDGAAM